MIRRTTWIVLVVFALLLGAAYYLSQNPLPKQDEGVQATVANTPEPRLLEGWQPQDIVFMELRGEAGNLTLTRETNGGWILSPENNAPVDAGKVENLRSQLASLQPDVTLTTLPAADQLGIASPANLIIVRNTQGQQVMIKIGKLAPTGSGYYIQKDGSAPVVVSKYPVDTILGFFRKDQLVAATPTPLVTDTPAPPAP